MCCLLRFDCSRLMVVGSLLVCVVGVVDCVVVLSVVFYLLFMFSG